MSTFLRYTGIFITSLATTLALLMGTGRLIAWQLPSFELELNNYLADRQISIKHIQSGWFGINPRITADEVVLPAISLHGVAIELDVLESLFRNRIVASTIDIDSAECNLEQTQAGWRLVGARDDDISFDYGSLIWHSDRIAIDFNCSVRNGDQHNQFTGRLRGQSHSGENHLQLTIAAQGDGCEECRMEVEVQNLQTKFYGDIKRTTQVVFHQFEVPSGLLGAGFLSPVRMNGSVQVSLRNGIGVSTGTLTAHSTRSDATDATFSLMLEASVTKHRIWGELRELSVSNEPSLLSLPNIAFSFDRNDANVHVWTDELETTSLVSLITSFAREEHIVDEWTRGMSPRATFRNVQAYYDEFGLTFRTDIEDLNVQGYLGSPELSLNNATVLGHGRSVLFRFENESIDLNFSDLFDTRWEFANADATVLMFLGDEFVGIRVLDASMAMADWTLRGDVAFWRDVTSPRYVTGVTMSVENLGIAQLRKGLPNAVPENTKSWIRDRISAGTIFNGRLIYHMLGGIEGETNPMAFEARGRFGGANVRYDSEWPEVLEGAGEFMLTRSALALKMTEAQTSGIFLNSGTLNYPFNASHLELEFEADTPLTLLMGFAVSTPIRDWLPFDLDSYGGVGPVDVRAVVALPVVDSVSEDADVDVTFGFTDVSVNLKDFDTTFTDLQGSVRYVSPNQVSSSRLEGLLFDSPVGMTFKTSDEDERFDVQISIEGIAAPADIARYVGPWIEGLATGESRFLCDVTIPSEAESATTMHITSDLIGTRLHLPDPYGKNESDASFIEAMLTFDEQTIAAIKFEDFEGVFSQDERDDVLRGSVGFGIDAPALDDSTDGVRVSGQLDYVALDMGSVDSELDFDSVFVLEDLSISSVQTGKLELSDVVLSGSVSNELIDIAIASNEVNGRASRDETERWNINLQNLEIDRSNSDSEEDFLAPDDVAWLPSIDLSIDEILLIEDGAELTYGSWSMSIDRHNDEVHVSNLEGVVRGLNIDATESVGVIWDTVENRSRFEGFVRGEDLAEVLPQWDFDVNIESETFEIEMNADWSGSPFMYELNALEGNIVGSVKEGRFLDMDPGGGALRITGLLNFTPILQRLQFDFRDVFAEGFSFDRVLFDVNLSTGIVQIDEPIRIKGKGSEILINGTMDMNFDTLDNEVVVVIPFSSSLPWYIGIITANPTAFIGSLVGKKLFEEQLDRIASSKYRVTGSIDDPDIEFIGLFQDDLSTQSMSDTNAVIGESPEPQEEKLRDE